MNNNRIAIGSRGSALALAQARLVSASNQDVNTLADTTAAALTHQLQEIQ